MDQEWWTSFGDPVLSALVKQALEQNTSVLSAAAAVDAARAKAGIARSALLPTANGTLQGGRIRTLEVTGPVQATYYAPGVEVAWELDFSGRLRQLSKAAMLAYKASQADEEAARLSIAAETARAYVALLSLDAQLTDAKQTVRSRQLSLELSIDRQRHGYQSQLQTTQAQVEYQQSEKSIPSLEQAIETQENALRILIGDLPAGLTLGPKIGDLNVPQIPPSLPSELIRRRPDVAAAEFRLAQTDAELNADRDAFLPQISLAANTKGAYIDLLDYSPVKLWQVGGSVLAPIFDGGRLESQVEVSIAQRDAAAYVYKETVLKAFQEVENALSSIAHNRELTEQAIARRETLTQAVALAKDQYLNGYASHLDLLDLERSLYVADLEVVQARASEITGAVDLYKALGGGWRRRTDGG